VLTDSVAIGHALAREPSYLAVPTPKDHLEDHLWATWRYGQGHAPSLLAVGAPGTGKTVTLRWMILDLILSPGSKSLWLADGKGADNFLMFTSQPGVAGIASKPDPASGKPDPIVKMIRFIHKETHKRYAVWAKAKRTALKTGKPVRYSHPPPMFFILDEYMDWEIGLSDKLRDEMLTLLISIAQIGREVNVHLWIATQAPYARSVEVGLPGLLKHLLKARIAMCGPMSLHSVEAKMAFDDAHASDRIESYARRYGLYGEDRLGLGLFQVGANETAFLAPWTPDPYHWETIEQDRLDILRLLPTKKIQLVTDEDEDEDDEEDDEEEPEEGVEAS
jgi:hypothetical protein